jgi:hypothetical protein
MTGSQLRADATGAWSAEELAVMTPRQRRTAIALFDIRQRHLTEYEVEG